MAAESFNRAGDKLRHLRQQEVDSMSLKMVEYFSWSKTDVDVEERVKQKRQKECRQR